MRVLEFAEDGSAREVTTPSLDDLSAWTWIDVDLEETSAEELEELADELRLDALAVVDAMADEDLPKVDDFAHHLLVVLHGLRADAIATYEIDCFLTERHLVTVRRVASPAIDSVWQRAQERNDVGATGVDELLARIADALTRRLLAVVDAFELRLDELVESALRADHGFLGDVAAVRGEMTAIRKSLLPQREVLDVLRHNSSPLLGHTGRRMLSDVFDVAVRASTALESTRTALAETLDAYRGAEAREATEVTRVLTIYAAVMLPLTLIAGFFGMNHGNLPTLDTGSGWIWVTAGMLGFAVISLTLFAYIGWIRAPSVRRASATLGRGVAGTVLAPVQVVGTAIGRPLLPLIRRPLARLEAAADDSSTS